MLYAERQISSQQLSALYLHWAFQDGHSIKCSYKVGIQKGQFIHYANYLAQWDLPPLFKKRPITALHNDQQRISDGLHKKKASDVTTGALYLWVKSEQRDDSKQRKRTHGQSAGKL